MRSCRRTARTVTPTMVEDPSGSRRTRHFDGGGESRWYTCHEGVIGWRAGRCPIVVPIGCDGPISANRKRTPGASGASLVPTGRVPAGNRGRPSPRTPEAGPPRRDGVLRRCHREAFGTRCARARAASRYPKDPRPTTTPLANGAITDSCRNRSRAHTLLRWTSTQGGS